MNSTTEIALRAKLRRFAEELTPEEMAELRVARPDSTIETPSPSLLAKAEQAVMALTPEELEHLHLLMQQAGAGTATDESADVSGYRMKLNQVQAMPEGSAGGAGGDAFLGRAALGLLGVIGIGLAGPNI